MMIDRKRTFVAILLAFCMSFVAIGCGDDGNGSTSVSVKPESEPAIVSVSIKSVPKKTDYFVGEELVCDGCVVTATLDDGSSSDITVTNDMTSGYDKTKAGLQYVSVDHTAGGKTASDCFAVTVREKLAVKSGGMTETDGIYTSTAANSLALIGGEFYEGAVRAEMYSTNTGDNGIVFALSSALSGFWEIGASYYFFFITETGGAYLGKVHDGKWSALSYTEIDRYVADGYHELKCERYFVGDEYAVIRCFVDGTLYATVRDYEPLHGTDYGLRAASSGVRYKDVETSEEKSDGEQIMDGLNIRNGDFTSVDDAFMAAAANSLASLPDKNLAYGTLSVKLTKNEIGRASCRERV